MDRIEQIIADQPRRYAVASLVGCCEGIVARGEVSEATEIRLRQLIAETLSAFGMPSKIEREAA